LFQLSFLNASLLIFAAATILPLLIWLLAKKKPLRVVFPTLRFIKLSKEQEKSRSKLKNILLLIIRMLIILLVALAVARPIFRSPKIKPSKKHPPTALAIILDTSYSMEYAEGGKSSLQNAKEAISKINTLCNPEDRLILITSNESWNLMHAQIYAGNIPQTLVEQISSTYSPLPLPEMLQMAETKLHESQMPNQEIYLISDRRMEPIKLKSSIPVSTIPLPLGQGFENIACTSAKVLPQLVDKRMQQSIQFTLENHGGSDRKDVLVKAIIGNIKVAEKFVSVPSQQSISETITCDVREDGWQSGYIEVVDERQIMDNRCYFAFPHFNRPRLGIISTAPSLPYFLASLIEVYSGSTPRIIRPETLSLSMLDSYQMFIVYEPGSLSPKLQEILSAITARKLGLLFCLGSTLNGDLKSYLNTAFGIELKERSNKAINIDTVNKHHYISALLSDKNLKHSTIADYWIANAKTANSIVTASSQALALQNGKQSLWLWNTASAANTFFMDPAFPVLAFRTLNFNSGSELPESSHRIGEMLSYNKLRLPGGELVTGSKLLASEPGIYTSDPDTPNLSAIAVNIDYSDSKNRNNQPTGAKQLGKDWENKLFQSRLGHDLWKTLLAIAFALVILELIIVKIEEARSQP
jgi:hypothetical protein